MIVLEFKAKGKTTQYAAIDEAILTAQFVRNKCIRYWMDNQGVGQKELYRLSKTLREEFPFAKALNSSACQASVERAYSSIARFYDNCKKSIPGKAIQNLRIIAAQWSTKLQDGNFPKLGNKSLSPTRKGLASSSSKERGI
jgi:putative transposase